MNRGWAATRSSPILPMITPTQAIIRDLTIDPPARKVRTVRPRIISEKYSGGPNFRATAGKRRSEEGKADDRQGSGDEGAEGRDPQGRPRPPLAGHLVAVEGGDHGSGFSGNVHQDGGCRSPVHRPVIDPGEHDDGGDGRGVKRRREEKGDRRHRSESGKHPDEGADQHPDKAEEEIDRLDGHLETEKEMVKNVRHPRIPRGN